MVKEVKRREEGEGDLIEGRSKGEGLANRGGKEGPFPDRQLTFLMRFHLEKYNY